MTSRILRAFAIVTLLFFTGKVSLLRADDNGRTLISRERILSALHSSGIPVVPEQMEQLSQITAAEDKPLLRVVSVDVMDGESDKVLLRCEHTNTCLPFYVLVHWEHSGEGSLTRHGRPDDDLARSGPNSENFLVRSGKIVKLVLDGNYIHMTLPVLCLQSGGRGQRVRVISKDTKKRYVARVTGPGVVTTTMSE
jgi:Chaperone for flagella basal body P-ring formation